MFLIVISYIKETLFKFMKALLPFDKAWKWNVSERRK